MGEARKVGNSHETYDFVAHDRVLYERLIASHLKYNVRSLKYY